MDQTVPTNPQLHKWAAPFKKYKWSCPSQIRGKNIFDFIRSVVCSFLFALKIREGASGTGFRALWHARLQCRLVAKNCFEMTPLPTIFRPETYTTGSAIGKKGTKKMKNKKPWSGLRFVGSLWRWKRKKKEVRYFCDFPLLTRNQGVSSSRAAGEVSFFYPRGGKAIYTFLLRIRQGSIMGVPGYWLEMFEMKKRKKKCSSYLCT